MSPRFVLLACLASTLFMTGVIWFVHVVHYPLFDRVQAEAFRRYHADHTRATGSVVILPMVVELLTSIALVARRPEGISPWMVWLGLAAALISWGSTFCFSVPAHGRLAGGFDIQAHADLVRTNTIRLVSWTIHSAVLLVMTARLLR
ncbi:hypothetical protein P12x_004846 [Tundrisphaera lichenicola]|uniref:hypothetical protein n=1 Tax=Tundrisphaera lichenicola TaxID=2029860 RepID=UPI003EBF5A9C